MSAADAIAVAIDAKGMTGRPAVRPVFRSARRHLRGARFVAFDSVATAQFAGLDRRQPVVVYCSVGVRSERLGERLHALGFRNVRNLYGGLFEWVNEGHPVVNAAGPTADVHPYSAFWGSWLRRGRKVYE